MTQTMTTEQSLTLNLTEEIHVRASLEATFEALLVQMGPGNETPDGKPLSMTLEARPGGRWFRDLGNNDGHLWGFVQAIKRPTLLEITGPLFMSVPVVSNVQYRLNEIDGGTLITFRHSALGFVPDDYRQGLMSGWKPLFDRIRNHAEAMRRTH
jgi:Activator of Hsp90 ATPase homolog 1-like protein